jgi:hypothetical protein
MIRVAEALWMCECTETGDSKHLKGIVEEARRLVFLAGGIDAIIAHRRERNRAKRLAAKELKQTTKEVYDTYGYYKPITIEDVHAK